VLSARSQGGFRLYTELDVQRLGVIMRMKPLDFQLDEMRELLGILDALASNDAPDRDKHLHRVTEFWTAADERCQALRTQLGIAENFAATLRSHLPAS
jgi:DNA-binding transcriptional MerR regulator